MTALRSLVAHHDVTWIASAIGEEDRAVATEAGGAFEETLRDGARCRLRLVVHDPAAYDRYYNVVANPTLWFLQHDLWELLEDRGDELARAWEDGYVPVNRAFAEAVLEELAERPDATVFFHDYHLSRPAPRPRRASRRAPGALHAHPVAATDDWRVLPELMRVAIHGGLWRTTWSRSTPIGGLRHSWPPPRARGREDARTGTIVAHPISIDPREFEELAVAARRCWRPSAGSRRVGRRRWCCASTVPTRRRTSSAACSRSSASSRRLRRRRRVGMRALLDPSRQDIPEYVTYLEAIRREIA